MNEFSRYVITESSLELNVGFGYLSIINKDLFYKFLAQEGQLDCLIWLNKYTRSVRIKTSVEQMNPALVASQEGRLDCLRYLARVEREIVKLTDRNGFNVIHYGRLNMFYLFRTLTKSESTEEFAGEKTTIKVPLKKPVIS